MANSLNDVIQKASSLADIISKRVAANAPKRTGNLQKALLKANNLNTLLNVKKGSTKQIPIKSAVFTINYAPDDAPYGMWWNDPTISWQVKEGTKPHKIKVGKKTKTIHPKNEGRTNFVDNALKEPVVQKALQDLFDLIGDTYLSVLDDELSAMEAEY